jgi:hypothetical protein
VKSCRAGTPKEVKQRKDKRCWAIVLPDVDQILPKYVVNFH